MPPHPDDDDDDDEDTFKLTFQNVRKRKAFAENFYCSGLKKRHIVKYVNEPEITSASVDVSMTSLTGSQQSMRSTGSAAGSQTSLMAPPTFSGPTTGSQTSLGSFQQQMGSHTNIPGPKFAGAGGTPKQVIKTITMPAQGGAFMTEKDITRASIKSLQVGLTQQQQQIPQAGPPAPPFGSLQVQTHQQPPVTVPAAPTVPRKIVKTSQGQLPQKDTDPEGEFTEAGSMGEDILRGAFSAAGNPSAAASEGSAESTKSSPLETMSR